MTGEWPKNQIDHINRIRDDDRWENLREATQSQNSYNRDWCEQNGDMRGIHKKCHKYYVYIGGEYLGNFTDLEEAKDIRDRALEAWGGEFAVPNLTQE